MCVLQQVQSQLVKSLLGDSGDGAGAGLRLIARLLDAGKSYDTIVLAVNELFFNLASNGKVLQEILRFASESGPAAQRWLLLILTMLSSEPEWLEKSFATIETPHSYVRRAKCVSRMANLFYSYFCNFC